MVAAHDLVAAGADFALVADGHRAAGRRIDRRLRPTLCHAGQAKVETRVEHVDRQDASGSQVIEDARQACPLSLDGQEEGERSRRNDYGVELESQREVLHVGLDEVQTRPRRGFEALGLRLGLLEHARR